jgi:iron complex outermembrane receptor protein
LGYDRNLQNVQQEVTFNFFNPKVGLTYRVGENHTAYASFGLGNKEPNRDDLRNSSPSSRPTHETLRNVEAGYRYVSGDLSLSANYFLMNYQNQLVLTGKINDVGEYTRTNIARSYRTGLETEIAWNFAKQWRWSANLTLSQNKVQDFSEYLLDYATEEYQKISYKKTDIAFSPNVIGASLLSYSPLKGLAISWQQKYVGAQYLDNTQSSSRKLDAYWLNDLRVQYTVLSSFAKEIQINALVANVLNLEYSSNGYTYGYAYDGQRTDENFLFPQAGRNFLLGLNIKF